MQMGVWKEDNDCERGAAAGRAGSMTSARTGRRREAMGELFFIALVKK